jgi:hypothetical protein
MLRLCGSKQSGRYSREHRPLIIKGRGPKKWTSIGSLRRLLNRRCRGGGCCGLWGRRRCCGRRSGRGGRRRRRRLVYNWLLHALAMVIVMLPRLRLAQPLGSLVDARHAVPLAAPAARGSVTGPVFHGLHQRRAVLRGQRHGCAGPCQNKCRTCDDCGGKKRFHGCSSALEYLVERNVRSKVPKSASDPTKLSKNKAEDPKTSHLEVEILQQLCARSTRHHCIR